MIDEKLENPEKAQRQSMPPSQRVDEIANAMERKHGTRIPPERRKAFESQVDRLEEIAWLLGR